AGASRALDGARPRASAGRTARGRWCRSARNARGAAPPERKKPGPLDTIVWEIGGPLVSTDDPSGRVIRIPNSLALSTAVYNYTAARLPYVWNDVKLLIAYGSDLEFVSQVMETAAGRHVTLAMRKGVEEFRRMAARTPIDARALHANPVLIFRSHESSWLEVTVRYLVDPRSASAERSTITREVLRALGNAPDRVLLPAGAER